MIWLCRVVFCNFGVGGCIFFGRRFVVERLKIYFGRLIVGV